MVYSESHETTFKAWIKDATLEIFVLTDILMMMINEDK